MKSIHLFIWALLILLALSSCKEEVPEKSVYRGKVEALKNGEPWDAKIYAIPEDTVFYIHGVKFDEWDVMRESFGITRVPYKNGTYILNWSRSGSSDLTEAFFILGEDDAVIDSYRIHEGSEPNFIKLTSYDPKSREVKGEFQAVFVINEHHKENQDPLSPDTIRFTNGTFHTRLVDPEDL